MNELNKAELRRLAEAAAHKDWYAGNAYGKPFILNSQIITDTPEGKYVLLDGNHHFRADCVANVAFVGAANPATVLSLLDQCDKAEAERDAALAELEALHIQVGTLTEWYSNALNVIAEVTAAIPGVTYMDLPDGGDVSIQEQIRRMAKDAERYRQLRDGSGWPAVFDNSDDPEPLRGDDLDAAMSREQSK